MSKFDLVSNWESRFDEELLNNDPNLTRFWKTQSKTEIYERVKDFIRKELQDQEKRILEKLNQALFYSDKKKSYDGEVLANHIMELRDSLEKRK